MSRIQQGRPPPEPIKEGVPRSPPKLPVAAQGHPTPQHGTAASAVASWRRRRRSETPCCQPCCHARSMPFQTLPPAVPHHYTSLGVPEQRWSQAAPQHATTAAPPTGSVAAAAALRDPLPPAMLSCSGHLPSACYPPTQHPRLSYTSLPSHRPDGTSTAAHTRAGQQPCRFEWQEGPKRADGNESAAHVSRLASAALPVPL